MRQTPRLSLAQGGWSVPLLAWLLAGGCTPAGVNLAPFEPSTAPAPPARDGETSEANAVLDFLCDNTLKPEPSSDPSREPQNPKETRPPETNAGGVLIGPSLEHVERPALTASGEPNGPYVGMTWEAARPHGFPAVTRDGRFIAHWVGEGSYTSPSPVYERAVVVQDVFGAERDRRFNLLTQQELLGVLPDGEAPSDLSLHLSHRRIEELEQHVQERVAVTNEWLAGQEWSPMSECRPEALVQAARKGPLRISVAASETPGHALVEIHRGMGDLLLRRDEPLGPCDGEPRLVSVAVAPSLTAVLVEVASLSNDACLAPNRVLAYALGSPPAAAHNGAP